MDVSQALWNEQLERMSENFRKRTNNRENMTDEQQIIMDGLVAAKNYINNQSYVDIGKQKAVLKRIDAAIGTLKKEEA